MTEEELKENKENENNKPNVQYVSFSEQQPDGTYKEAYGYVDYSEDDQSTIDEQTEELRSFLRR